VIWAKWGRGEEEDDKGKEVETKKSGQVGMTTITGHKLR